MYEEKNLVDIINDGLYGRLDSDDNAEQGTEEFDYMDYQDLVDDWGLVK